MSAAVMESQSVTGRALVAIHEELDGLLAAGLGRESDEAVLDAVREAERVRRRLAALDHQLISQVQQRGLGYSTASRDTAGLLASMLRISSREAHARVQAAAVCGPRSTLQGEVLPAVFDQIAAAQATGQVSVEAARTITTTLTDLPGEVDLDYAQTVHDTLLHLATVTGPERLAKAARHALLVADQDGTPPQIDARREQRRDVTVQPRPGGSSSVRGDLNAECSELLQAYFDAYAAPRPATGGVKDPRTGGQRRHDALLDLLKAILRTDHPSLTNCTANATTAAADAAAGADVGAIAAVSGIDTEAVTAGGTGVGVTVLLTMTADAWLTGRGHAVTGHGAVIPAAEAIRWAGGDARVMAVVFDQARAVTAYSSTRRIFTRNQRLAMTARDRGCTFPACAAPPGWCEAHHVTDYAKTGTTGIEDGALVCGYDHRERINQGWTTTMINHRPHWVPPPWIDQHQTPIRNTLHDLD